MTPLEQLRHSTAHVMAAAILRRFPQTQLDIGPPTSKAKHENLHPRKNCATMRN